MSWKRQASCPQMTTNHKLDIQWAKGHDKALCVAVEKSKVTQWRWTHQQLEAEKQQRHKADAANDRESNERLPGIDWLQPAAMQVDMQAGLV